jgi:GNAT superfamily N-acetyltransferase
MVNVAATDSQFSVREGTLADWPVLRLLLPDVFNFGAGLMSRVATDRGSGVIVAAIAIDTVLQNQPVLGVRVAMHVVPPFRQRGVEAQLLSAAEEIARLLGACALYTWGAIETDSDTARYWEDLGFDQGLQLQQGQTLVATGLKFLEPYWQELVRRGKVPAGIVAVPIEQADPAELAQMYSTYIGGTYDMAHRRLTGLASPRFDHSSTVILQNDRIAGVSLGHLIDNGVGVVEAVIIDPPFRGTWASVFLRRESWSRCAAAGIHTLLYYTQERHRDTRRFVAKAGTTIRDYVKRYRRLTRE